MSPFSSEAQRRFLWLKHPDVAKKWSHEHPEINKGLPYHVAANEAVKRHKEKK